MADRALVSTRKGLFFLKRDGDRWHIADHQFVGEPVTIALADPRDGRLYAGLNLGHFGPKLHRSEDGGRSWREISVPAFPDDAADKPAFKQLWALEPGGRDESGTLWAGGIPAGLFRSQDCGDSWRFVDRLWNVPGRKEWFGGGYDDPGIHSIALHPHDPRRIHVGISCGGVWETTDGGLAWDVRCKGLYGAYLPPESRENPNMQDPHRIARCGGAPDVFWMQHHNGVFRSEDGGRSWMELGPPVSKFGFAVAAHPADPLTAWFVPATSDERRIPVDGKICVNRTRDGGKTFETLRWGLPQEHAFDLVYRHGLDADETGERLIMGSTSGALWTSSDAGESWHAVTGRLPPVYAVRFG